MADMGDNELRIIGDSGPLQRFKRQSDERRSPVAERDPYNGQFNPSVFSFHRLVPVPADVAKCDYGAPGGGYEWQKENWGVKWGASHAEVSAADDSLLYCFQTAWDPPLSFVQKASGIYPTLTFLLTFRPPMSLWPEEYAIKAGEIVDADDLF